MSYTSHLNSSPSLWHAHLLFTSSAGAQIYCVLSLNCGTYLGCTSLIWLKLVRKLDKIKYQNGTKMRRYRRHTRRLITGLTLRQIHDTPPFYPTPFSVLLFQVEQKKALKAPLAPLICVSFSLSQCSPFFQMFFFFLSLSA